MRSIWSETVCLPQGEPLPGDLTAEAAVIGGGLTGVLTARLLQEQGVETVLLEAEELGSGQTKHTTAKLTTQHAVRYQRLLETFGPQRAKAYAQANQEALRAMEDLILAEEINCHYRTCSAYLYTCQDPLLLEREAKAAGSLGLETELVYQTELPFPVRCALRFPRQGQFHPLEFLAAAARPLTVYTHTRALSVEGQRIRTPLGAVTARHIIFATHYPFVNWPGLYFARMHQERSYVLALEGAQVLNGMYYGVDPGGLSFRSYEALTLLGGGGHRTGENSAGGSYALLSASAQRFWPGSQETARWSAQDCVTLDGAPYIGPFSPSHPHWYVATGYAKWGMTSSMVAARLLSGLILGRMPAWAVAFTPRRFPRAAAGPLVMESGQSCKGLARRFFQTPPREMEALAPGHGGLVRMNGRKVGAYRDETGGYHVVIPRCPHLGCQLEWNPEERSWDCPCHGSRFDWEGKVLDNPAQADLEQP